jgi:hypothetical protein
MLFLPGPGIATIILGVGILALEFAIAQAWVVALRQYAERTADRARVPRGALWALPVAGIGVTVACGVLTAMFGVVHGDGTWEVVRKPGFDWNRSWVSYAQLQADAPASAEAAAMLARVVHRPAAVPAAPAAAPAPSASPPAAHAAGGA